MFAFRAAVLAVSLAAVFSLVVPSTASAQAPLGFRPMTMPFHYSKTVYPALLPRADMTAPRGHLFDESDGRTAQAARVSATFGVAPSVWSPPDDVGNPDLLVRKKFAGLIASPTICDGPCGSPGSDLAASKTWLFESVGISFAVYAPTGVLQAGWPKNYITFFGVPSPGACDPSGPGVTLASVDFDPATSRFFAFMIAIEGQIIGDTCPDSYQVYAAVSATSNPNGAWNVFVSTPVPGDLVLLNPGSGITPQAVCISANGRNQPAPHAFLGAVFGCANTKSFESSGGPINGFSTTTFDTLEPATVYPVDPGVEIFISSANQLAGSCLIGPCDQYLLADMSNPGSASPSLSTLNFISPLKYNPTNLVVDQPGCTNCVRVNDNRVEPHPVLNKDGLFFAHNTGFKHSGAFVTGALWGQINVTLDPTTHGLTSANFAQGGIVKFAGDRSAASPAITVDLGDDAVLVFDTVGSAVNPSMEAASRLNTAPPGVLSKVKFIAKGTAPTSDGSIIEYGGATFDPAGRFWIAHSSSNGQWATEIAKVKP
jgi:hypothetical protein